VAALGNGIDPLTCDASQPCRVRCLGHLDVLLTVSGRTEQQVSALAQTAANMGVLGTVVHHNAGSARQANRLAQGGDHHAGHQPLFLEP
jgi:hypothetical protein